MRIFGEQNYKKIIHAGLFQEHISVLRNNIWLVGDQSFAGSLPNHIHFQAACKIYF